MTLCVNPDCPKPQNPDSNKFCQNCGAPLLLHNGTDPAQNGCYRALKQIGAGGFSKTYLAVDESQPSKPRCIIKQFRQPLTPEGGGTRETSDSFREEVARLTKIGEHPQIPTLLAACDRGSRQYVVQEFIDGSNLAQELAENGSFSETQIRQLLEEVLPILHFIHHHRLIHRDIKPENIIRTTRSSQIVLVDFGAAKHATHTAFAKVGTLIGSAEYTAPEQLRGKPTFASDLYSFGVTCIHLLTNISPFDLFDALEGTWIWRDYLLNPVTDSLASILDRMLIQRVRNRYHCAEEVLKELNPKVIPKSPQRTKNKGQVVMVSQPRSAIANKAGEGEGSTNPQSTTEQSTTHNQPPTIPHQPSTKPAWKCVQTLMGTQASAEVNAIAFNAQCRMVASASWDGAIALWDLGTGELLHTLTGHNQGVLSLAMSQDGQTLVSGSADCTVKIWRLWQLSPKDLRDGVTPIATHTLAGHRSIVASVAICPDRQLLASGSRDKTIKLWNLNTGELQHTLTGHSERISSVVFNPKWATTEPERSHILASGSADGSIHIWQVDRGELKYELMGHSGAVNAVEISSDGTTLISCSWDRTSKIWNLPAEGDGSNFPTLTQTFCSHVLPAVAIAIAPDGTTFATASHDTMIKLWNLKSIEEIATLSGHTRGVTSVTFSPDGKTLASGSQDGTVKLWRCE